MESNVGVALCGHPLVEPQCYERTYQRLPAIIIGWTIVVLGFISTGLTRLRLIGYRRNQTRLKQKYDITRNTPVLPYGPRLEHSIQNRRHQSRPRRTIRSNLWLHRQPKTNPVHKTTPSHAETHIQRHVCKSLSRIQHQTHLALRLQLISTRRIANLPAARRTNLAQLLLNATSTLPSAAQPHRSSTRLTIRPCRRALVDPDHLKPRRALQHKSIDDLDIPRRARERLASMFQTNQGLV